MAEIFNGVLECFFFGTRLKFWQFFCVFCRISLNSKEILPSRSLMIVYSVRILIVLSRNGGLILHLCLLLISHPWLLARRKGGLSVLPAAVIVPVVGTLGGYSPFFRCAHSVVKGWCWATFISLEGQNSTAGPSKNGEEGKENCANDVRAGEWKFDVLGLAPGDAHVNKGDEIKKSPESWEGHVENDEMLPCLDGGHLFKKPFSDEESDGGQKRNNADHSWEMACGRFHIHHTNLLSSFLHKKPSRRGNAPENYYRKKQSAYSHANDGAPQKCQGVLGPAGLCPPKGPATISPGVHWELYLLWTSLTN